MSIPTPQPAIAISRRGFAAALATAATAALPTPALSATDDPPKSDLPAASAAEAEAAFAAAIRQHGQRLSEVQRTDLRRLIIQNQKALDALRAFAIDNADEPATVLNPTFSGKN